METTVLSFFWGSLATQVFWYHRQQIIKAASRMIKKGVSSLWSTTKRLAKSGWQKRKHLFGNPKNQKKAELSPKMTKKEIANTQETERKPQFLETYKKHKTIKKQRYMKTFDPQAATRFQEWVMEQKQIRSKKTPQEIQKETDQRLNIRWMLLQYLKPPSPQYLARCQKELQRQQKEFRNRFPRSPDYKPYNPIVDRIEPSPYDVEVIQY